MGIPNPLKKTTQAFVVNASDLNDSTGYEQFALFDGSGNPIRIDPSVVTTLTDAATIAVDSSVGKHFAVTLGGNRTMGVPSKPADGKRVTFEVKQDATGGRTLAWSSAAGGFSFGAASAPTVTATANATSLVSFVYSARVGKWLYLASTLGF